MCLTRIAQTAVFFFVCGSASHGAALLVDRGLPAADSQGIRLRVSWSAKDGIIVTDHFMLGEPGESWVIDKVRTWAVPGLEPGGLSSLGDLFDRISLYGGLETEKPPADSQTAAAECACHGPIPIAGATLRRGSNVSQSPQVALTPVASASYREGGRSLSIWQIDFQDLRWHVPGGASVQFGVLGVGRPATGGRGKSVWSNHASSTSGKHQLRLFETGGSPVVPADGVLPADESVGINVQVWGHLTANAEIRPLGKTWEVVLAGSPKFDVLRVKPDSLRFGPRGAAPAGSRVEDSDHDGHADLVLHFGAAQAGIGPDELTGCLSGVRLDSVPFEACGLTHSARQ
jgi:hypothetical protein